MKRNVRLWQKATTISVLALSLLLPSCRRHDARTTDAGRQWNLELLESAAVGDLAGIAGKLTHGADPNYIPDPGGTASPLINAAKGGHSAAVRLLLQRGALPNVRTANETPLHAAAARGSASIVRLLVQFGSNVNARVGNLGREDALGAAVLGGHAEAAWILYAEGGRVEPWHLCAAVRAANVATVNVLLNAGLDPHSIDCGGSPLSVLAQNLRAPQRDEIRRRLNAGVLPREEQKR
jgi:ankyrin repeat protein